MVEYLLALVTWNVYTTGMNIGNIHVAIEEKGIKRLYDGPVGLQVVVAMPCWFFQQWTPDKINIIHGQDYVRNMWTQFTGLKKVLLAWTIQSIALCWQDGMCIVKLWYSDAWLVNRHMLKR